VENERQMKIFDNIKRESVRDKVYASIRGAILSGKLRTGQRIPEVPLAEEFQVSRAIVREALQQLAHEGLVEQSSYKVTRVVRLTVEQIDEIIGVRLLLESEAFRQAAIRASEADCKALRALARKLEGSVRNPRQFVEHDLALHDKVWEIAGNSTIRKLLHQITPPVFAMSIIMRMHEDRRAPQSEGNWRLGDHSRLIEAVCEGAPERAVKEIRFHLTENFKTTRERLRAFLEGEADEAIAESVLENE